MRVAGFVLTGGKSTRMGRDKARLSLASHLLIEDVADKVRGVAESVALIGRAAEFADLRYECLDDLRPDSGPLCGIETALRSGRGELNLIVACDMPGLKKAWLQDLVTLALQGGHACVVCRDSLGRVHPLCAVYRSSCLESVGSALDSGRLRLLELVAELRAAEVSISEPILNVNSPADWASWLSTSSAPGSVAGAFPR